MGAIDASGSAGVERQWSALVDVLLAIGFLALTGAVALSYLRPARTYELSIYAATPGPVWAGIGVALLTALVVAVGVNGSRRVLALALGTGSFAAVAALPLIRGYHFYGGADSLTHLGYLRDIASGATTVESFFYPGLHTLALTVSEGTGFSRERALVFVVFVTAVVFVVFVTLLVRTLVDAELGTSIGLFAAILLLPVNHVATHYIEPHSMSQTVLLFPLWLYLLVVYVRSDRGGATVTPVGGLLALVSVATILYHPMQATMGLVLFATVVVLQGLFRRHSPQHPIASHRRVYGQAAFAAVAYALWTLGKPTFTNTVSVVGSEIQSFFSGSANAGAFVGDQSASLTAIGSGIGEIFLKLFLVSAVFAALAGVLALGTVRNRFDVPEAGLQYLAAALFTLVPASLALFVGDVSRLAFRLLGSVMVVVTVLGAVVLYRLANDRSGGGAARPVRIALVVVLAAMLVHSLAIVYTSPYMYKANRQVSDAQLTGYENAFEIGNRDIRYAGIRGGPSRYMQAVYGANSVPSSLDLEYHQQRGAITGANLTRIDERYRTDRYLVVSKRDVLRELGAYESLRYNRSQLSAIHTQQSVHRIRANGAFRLYLHDESRTNADGPTADPDSRRVSTAQIDDGSTASPST
jgi:hypothetical protein